MTKSQENLSRKSSDQMNLDDLIFEMQNRPNSNGKPTGLTPNASSGIHPESGVFSSGEEMMISSPGSGADPHHPDLYAQLEQKERDLLLAAELGKALLDKNEELSRQNEKMAEEYSVKLEELEQEKYHLRRKLETAQEEYDIKVNELQHDLNNLQAQLDEHSNMQKQTDKEKSLLITTLTEQNQRLTTQLKEITKNEDSLTSELQQLRNQVNLKRTSMNEHVSHLDMLRDEITLMTERKIDLERRIELLQGEREGLSSTLDESADRIIMLEKQSREQDSLLRSNEKAMDELRSANQTLQDRLENMYRAMSLSPNQTPNQGALSLLNEMELSDSEHQNNVNNKRSFHHIEEEVECEHPEDVNLSALEMRELKEEILSCYQQIRSLSGQLRRREKIRNNKKQQQKSEKSNLESLEPPLDVEDKGDEEENLDTLSSSGSSSGDEPTTIASLRSGLLQSGVQELKGLLHDLLRKESKGTCATCGFDSNDRLRLEVQLHNTTEVKEKGERKIRQLEDEVKRKDEELLELTSKLSVTEIQLAAATEERDTLRADLDNTEAGKDELIRKAWETRDAAVKRKNNTQIELARARIDVMQVNSQLLEAITQKVELSQQLDQWQADMEELLEEQMVRKMRDMEKKGRAANAGDSDSSSGAAERKKSRILSFFQRS